jgi:ABC-2 type transport system permease protein
MTAMTSREAGFRPGRWYPENSVPLLVLQTWVQTKRILTRWARDLITVLEAFILPILILLIVDIVLGHLIYAMTHDSALYSLVPLLALGAAIGGSNFVAVDLMRERSNGMLSRLWVLPAHRASGLLSRIVAEGVRIAVTTLVILGAGVILGFRFREGAVAGLMWVTVPVIFSMAFAMLVATIALYTSEILVIEAVELMQIMLVFFSTGVLPLHEFPRWIQPIVAHQPMSYATTAMRGLSAGGPVGSAMVMMLLWSAGIAAACVVPMVIGYRRASTR